MHYQIDPRDLSNHILRVHLAFMAPEDEPELAVAWWRPGRYTESGFYKRIRDIRWQTAEAEGRETELASNIIKLEGVKKDEQVMVEYLVKCDYLDAGNTWMGEQFCLVNPVSFILFLPGREGEEITLAWRGFEDFDFAGVTGEKSELLKANYQQLIDRPLLFARELQRASYAVEGVVFEICVAGRTEPIPDDVINDFQKFTETQIELFGEFPANSYRFLIISPEYRFYHGVEHADSTVIVLGPDEDLFGKLRDSLLGVSSHELFHAWNVCRMRPAELSPYTLSAPVYFETGWLMEGLTTYYGDLMLLRSGVKDAGWFISEMENLLTRHWQNPARLSVSMSESSRLLWTGGYGKVLPPEVLSIYVEGALICLVLDLLMLDISEGELRLDGQVQALWEQFGNAEAGYTSEQLAAVLTDGIPAELNPYYEMVSGKGQISERVKVLLERFGFRIMHIAPDEPLKKCGAMITSEGELSWCWPGSPADDVLEPGDIIKDSAEKEGAVSTIVLRKGKEMEISMSPEDDNIFFERIVLDDITAGDVEAGKRQKFWLYS